MKRIPFYLFMFLLTGALFWQCEEDNPPEPEYTADDSLKAFIYQVMERERWYYWYDEMPKLDPDAIESPYAYFDSLLYKEKDKFSFITDLETYRKHYQEGKYKGLGMRMKFDADKNLYVAFTYEDSPMAKNDIRRGYKILSINGFSANDIYSNGLDGVLAETANQIVLESPQGEQQTITVSQEEVNETPVLADTVFQQEEDTIGYFVFQNFIEPAQPALDTLFSHFQKQGVTDLVVDLRYNGGGILEIARQLASLIAGNKAGGALFYKTIHNQYHSEQDEADPLYLQQRNYSLDVDRVLFITTSSTASASEAVVSGLDISALQGQLDLKLVGTPTYGKPVGMYPMIPDQEKYPLDKVVAPVTFKGVNADNEGDYFGGIAVDARRKDDLTRRLGNPEEACLKEALYYLKNGGFSVTAKVAPVTKPRIQLEGMQREIGAL